MTNLNNTAAAACLILSSAIAGGAWMRVAQQNSQDVEVRDDSGRVRCRLGRIDGLGYGLQLIGEDGADQAVLSLDKGGIAFRGLVGKETSVALVGNKDGAEITLGDPGGNHVRMGLQSSGEFALKHSAGDEQFLVVRSVATESGRSCIEVRHPGKRDAASGFAWIADAKGASLDLLRGGQSVAQIASMSEGMSYLLLGARRLGVYVQAAANGNLLFEMCNKTPRLTVQSAEGGTGIGIDRKNGSSAFRLGLSQGEEATRKIFDGNGQQLPWDAK